MIATDRTAARRGDRGAAAVEMALIMPLLLLILFGIIDFGRMLNAKITVTEAAREGARAVALGHPAAEEIEDATSRLPAPPAGSPCAPAAVCWEVVNGCGNDADGSDADADDAKVSVSYEFDTVTPLGALMEMYGDGSDGPLTIAAEGVMPCLGSG